MEMEKMGKYGIVFSENSIFEEINLWSYRQQHLNKKIIYPTKKVTQDYKLKYIYI